MTNQSTPKALPDFSDPRVQKVYNILCSQDPPPKDGQHWEGWCARNIVAELFGPSAVKPKIDQLDDYKQLLALIVSVLQYKAERTTLLHTIANLKSENDIHAVQRHLVRATVNWDNACACLAIWLEDNTTREWYVSRFGASGLTIAEGFASDRITK